MHTRYQALLFLYYNAQQYFQPDPTETAVLSETDFGVSPIDPEEKKRPQGTH